MLDRLEKIADEKIRPYLARHNGDINIVSFEDGVVKVRLVGGCSGCPGAQLTMAELVESAIMEEITDVKEVVLLEGVSDEMLDFAKKFLKKDR